MKKIIKNNKLSEELIINKYLSKLNFNKKGTFNFKNDGAFIQLKKNRKLVITTDSITEDIDFFKGDNPKSIANKIITINLSDLSAMGATPYSYSLNLFLPKYIDINWINKFTNELLKIQKKYNFYLVGGDLCNSSSLSISSTFFGLSNTNKIIRQNNVGLNNDIWITGNIGDSYTGLQFLKKKINVNNNDIYKYFLKKYYFPKTSTFGSKISTYVKSMKDISDGFIGDLRKMLDNKYGAKIKISEIPLSSHLKKLINKNLIKKKYVLNAGDNYELILISDKKFRKKIINLANKNKVKISRVGETIKNKNIIDDSNNLLNIPKEFDHFC